MKLLLIVGAGASIELGMPSVNRIDSLLEEWAKQRYQIVDFPQENLYTYLKKKIITYYNRNPEEKFRKATNFEEIFHVALQLSSMMNDCQNHIYKNPLNAFMQVAGDLEKIIMYDEEQIKGMDLYHLVSYLTDELLKKFRRLCIDVQNEKIQKFEMFKNFMEDLKKDFQIGCISLNYDDLIKQALPDLRTGFNEKKGDFNRNSVFNIKDWNFVYHIHGSVHFDMQGDRHEIKWNSDLNGHFNDSFCRNPQYTTEGLLHPTSNIIAGYDKTNQILRAPFRTYYSVLDRLVHDADSYLFIGYGFNDLHINKSFTGFRNHSTKRPVLVIDWADDKKDPLGSGRRDKWAINLCDTIPVNTDTMKYDAMPSGGIGELKRNNEFEVSEDSDHPLAIWYGGFIKACKNYDKIKQIISC